MVIAERFASAVVRVIDDIVANPWTGRTCALGIPELADLRSRAVSAFDAYVVFYVVERGQVEVIRVLHGARDLERVLLDRDEPDAVHEAPIAAGALDPTVVETASRVAC